MRLFAAAKFRWPLMYTTTWPQVGVWNGGKAMFTSPKILIAKFMIWLSGEEHSEDCVCEVCQYNRDDSYAMLVKLQRDQVINGFSYGSFVTAALPWEYPGSYCDEEDEEIDFGVVMHYANWFMMNYPEATERLERRYGDNIVIDSLNRAHPSNIGGVLLHLLEDGQVLSPQESYTYNQLYIDSDGNVDPVALAEALVG